MEQEYGFFLGPVCNAAAGRLRLLASGEFSSGIIGMGRREGTRTEIELTHFFIYYPILSQAMVPIRVIAHFAKCLTAGSAETLLGFRTFDVSRAFTLASNLWTSKTNDNQLLQIGMPNTTFPSLIQVFLHVRIFHNIFLIPR
jgi:hypothetical protein